MQKSITPFGTIVERRSQSRGTMARAKLVSLGSIPAVRHQSLCLKAVFHVSCIDAFDLESTRLNPRRTAPSWVTGTDCESSSARLYSISGFSNVSCQTAEIRTRTRTRTRDEADANFLLDFSS